MSTEQIHDLVDQLAKGLEIVGVPLIRSLRLRVVGDEAAAPALTLWRIAF
jgi:hypothetical protein